MKKLIATLIACLALQGCGAAVVSGLALAGYTTYDHNNLETRIEDKTITYQAYANIRDNAEDVKANIASYEKSHIIVTSFYGNVLTVGQVPTEDYKNTVTAILQDTKNVIKVYNQLSVGPVTSLSTQTSDTWITTTVKAALLTDEHVPSANIKVITEDGVVYLMGYLRTQEATSATSTVRKINGVKKVVTLFDYSRDDTV